jgi:hypothetical protein
MTYYEPRVTYNVNIYRRKGKVHRVAATRATRIAAPSQTTTATCSAGTFRPSTRSLPNLPRVVNRGSVATQRTPAPRASAPGSRLS